MTKKNIQIIDNRDNALSDAIVIIEYGDSYRLSTTVSQKALRVLQDEESAIKYAKKIQQNIRGEIYLMNEKGKLTKRYPYINQNKVKALSGLKMDK